MAGLPVSLHYKETPDIVIRALMLNCLTEFHSELWRECYKDIFRNTSWSKKDTRLPSIRFKQLSDELTKEYAFRTDFERRQALVEIDVLAAMALGMNLQQLKTIYRIQFPVLQSYEADTWYDANGQIVFTNNRSLTNVGFPRTEWEKSIKGAKDGEKFYRTIIDDTTPYGAVERTIEYVAPFDRCDREQDYEIAWHYFEEKVWQSRMSISLHFSGSGIIEYDNKKIETALYLNREYGFVRLKMSFHNWNVSFIEIPLSVESFYGELSNGYLFTALNCNRVSTNSDVSRNICTMSYDAEYLIEGIKGSDGIPSFHTVFYEMSNLMKWGGLSVYSLAQNNSLSENGASETTLIKTNDFSITYRVIGSILPVVQDDLLNEKITLHQQSYIKISFQDEQPISKYQDVIKKIEIVLELLTLRKTFIRGVTAFSHRHRFKYDGLHEEEVEFNVLWNKLNTEKDAKDSDYKIITLSDFKTVDGFTLYLQKYEKLKPIIELYYSTLNERESSPSRQFLNLTQALETYHARFKANKINEYRNRVSSILEALPEFQRENARSFLLQKEDRMILDNRIADLVYAEGKVHFDLGAIAMTEFPNTVASTRNFYTHYDETIKNRGTVLDEEDLVFCNIVLICILEFYLLRELGFTDELKLRGKVYDRWGSISTQIAIKNESEKRKKDINSVH